MGIGPVLDCPNDLSNRLSAVLATEKIRVERREESLIFRRRFGQINGRVRVRKERTLLWLTFHHAFNPLFWYFDSSLLKRIERILQRNGASISDFDAFAEEE